MVSIIVPVYNAEKYIKRCLDSIINQTIQDIEVILVDDGSSDSSLTILQSYAEKDRRIKVISQENRGVSAARNSGLKNVTGNYILYVDSDDWIEADLVERLLSRMNTDVDIVLCSFDNAEIPERVLHETNVKYEFWDRNRQMLEFMQHKRMTGMLWNKLIRRRLTFGILFNEKTSYGEDAEFLWQILKKSRKMVVTNEVLYHHVLEKNSISHLSFSEKKFSAIPMWESIKHEVEMDYPEFLKLAKERLTCVAVFSMYEAHKCKFKNKKQIKYMRHIIRKTNLSFWLSSNVSIKFKLYALAVFLGY